MHAADGGVGIAGGAKDVDAVAIAALSAGGEIEIALLAVGFAAAFGDQVGEHFLDVLAVGEGGHVQLAKVAGDTIAGSVADLQMHIGSAVLGHS